MAAFISSTTPTTYTPPLLNRPPKFNRHSSFFSRYPNPKFNHLKKHLFCFAAKQQQQSGPVKKRQSSANNKKPVKNKGKNTGFNKGFVTELEVEDDGTASSSSSSGGGGKVRYQPLPLPKPPAGFLVDDQGRVVAVSDRRIATIVDPANNFPLECVIRRVFRSSQGDECMLLCPIDTPVQILKSTNFEGWSALSDDEVESILPTASYALAKIHMHLVYSGFCYTARGGFCYTEDDIFECGTDVKEKLLDALPKSWQDYASDLQEREKYDELTLEQVVSKLKGRQGKRDLKTADGDFTQDPSLYHAVPTSLMSGPGSSSGSGSATAFLSSDVHPVIDGAGKVSGYVSYEQSVPSSSSPAGTSKPQTSNSSFKSMPMSMKSAEDRMHVYAALCSAHEAFIQGKITDPALINEDYDQLDPDDLEEMDISWQLAMLSIKIKRFTQRTGRRLNPMTKGFDKSKVKCYNCDGFGHFARECQRERRDRNSATGRQNYNQAGNFRQINQANAVVPVGPNHGQIVTQGCKGSCYGGRITGRNL